MQVVISAVLAACALPILSASKAPDPVHRTAIVESPSTWGPPAICFPLEVSGRTLPWGEGAMQAHKDYKLAQLRPDLLPLLETEGTLTRMENLRRAAILLSPLHRGATDREQQLERERLLSILRGRVVEATVSGAKQDLIAARIFDLGYLQAALGQIAMPHEQKGVGLDYGSGSPELKHAGKVLNKEGAVRLGLALGLFDMRRGQVDRMAFKRCAELVGDDKVLALNLRRTAKHFLAAEDYDELVAFLDR